jgi:hypothetical protein
MGRDVLLPGSLHFAFVAAVKLRALQHAGEAVRPCLGVGYDFRISAQFFSARMMNFFALKWLIRCRR